MTAQTPPTAQGSIYDLGYQGYDGPRLGRLPVALGLLRSTLAAAWGIGRGGRAKIAPLILFGMAMLPAVVAVGISALASQAGAGELLEEASPIRHSSYQGLTATIVMLFCAAQGPELFGRDQRYGVLPLYFSRVLTRFDYAIARVLGLFLAILIVALAPQVLLTLGAVFAAEDPITGLAEELPEIPRYLTVTILASALFAAVSSAVAAFTPRRAYATAGIIAAFLIPSVVSILVSRLSVGDLARFFVLISPADVTDGLNAGVYGTLPDSPAVIDADLSVWVYVATAVGGTLALVAAIVRRYQRLST